MNSAIALLIVTIATEIGVDPWLAQSVALQENPLLVPELVAGPNSNGTYDYGIMGLNSAYIDYFASHYWDKEGTFDWRTPEHNIYVGLRHLKYLIGIPGWNVWMALIAYNAGEAAVRNGNPPDASIEYANRVFIRWHKNVFSLFPVDRAVLGGVWAGGWGNEYFFQLLPGCIPANGGGGLMDSGGIFYILFPVLGFNSPKPHKPFPWRRRGAGPAATLKQPGHHPRASSCWKTAKQVFALFPLGIMHGGVTARLEREHRAGTPHLLARRYVGRRSSERALGSMGAEV